MQAPKRLLAVFCAAALALSGCGLLPDIPRRDTSRPQAAAGEATSPADPALPEGEHAGEPGDPGPQGEGTRYIDQVVQETIGQFYRPGMSEFEMAKAAFDYMIENASLIDPVGLDIWRYRDENPAPLSFVENRSLSVLLFGVGKCEDYAAALTLLLRGMGLEAEYVPGLTYSTQGALVDHAWTVVRVDGVWYHLDCQLEQNISGHGSIRYKYFMRSDATMAGSHRWGQNLIDSRLLTGEQNQEIARDYIPPACPQDYATPERRSFTAPTRPDLQAVLDRLNAERRDYQAAHGPLEPLELNTIPPVFGLEGYGPQD